MTDNHLYHYCKIDANGLGLLINSRFYFSVPAEVNDPFDSKGIFLNQGAASDYEYHHWLCSKAQNPEMSEEDRKKEWKTVAERLASNPQLKECLFEQFRSSTEEKLSRIRFVCLCKKHNDILMWSHYADKHSGMCLKFDRQVLAASSNDISVDDVHYGLPTFSDWIDVKREGGNVGKYLATSKASEWVYEAEVRLVAQLLNGKKLVGLDETNRFLSFDPKALTGIIFGCKTKEEDKQTVYNIFKDKKHCPKFHVASACKDRYELTFEDWDPNTAVGAGTMLRAYP